MAGPAGTDAVGAVDAGALGDWAMAAAATATVSAAAKIIVMTDPSLISRALPRCRCRTDQARDAHGRHRIEWPPRSPASVRCRDRDSLPRHPAVRPGSRGR